MRRSTSIAVGCLLIGAGVFADRLMLGKPRAAPVGDSSDTRAELAEMRSAIDDLRRSIDRAGAKSASVPVAAATAPAATACPSETKQVDEAKRLEQQRNHPAWHDAETLVATAISSGRWTESDILRFRELAREAPDIDLVPLMQKVDVAINTRRLRPDPDLIELH